MLGRGVVEHGTPCSIAFAPTARYDVGYPPGTPVIGLGSESERGNFFVLDFRAVDYEIVDVTMNMERCGVKLSGSKMVYTVTSPTSPYTAYEATSDCPGGLFTSIENGQELGGMTVTDASPDTLVVQFSAQAIEFFNNQRGKIFAVGGYITPDAANSYLFDKSVGATVTMNLMHNPPPPPPPPPPSHSRTRSPSKSGTPTSSPRSHSASPSSTPSASSSPSVTRTVTPTPRSLSSSPSATPSASPTETPTPTPSRSHSATSTRTPSPSASSTPSVSSSPTRSRTQTPSQTPSTSPSRSASTTPTQTPSRTPTTSPSLSSSQTATRTRSPTSTPSQTATPSDTPTPSPRSLSSSPTPTRSPSQSPSITRTPSSSPVSVSRTASSSPRSLSSSPSKTPSPTASPSKTPSRTATPSTTPSPTSSASHTSSPTASVSKSLTSSRSHTSSRSLSASTSPRSRTSSPTESSTPSASMPPAVPLVAASQPAPGAIGVPLDTAIMVNFTQTMFEASVEHSFSMTDPSGLTQLGGRYAWFDAGMSLHYLPSSPLLPSTEYVLRVNTTAEDDNGIHMLSMFVLTFITAYNVPAAPVLCSPLFHAVGDTCPPGWQLYVIVAVCALLVVAVACTCFCWCRRRQAQRKARARSAWSLPSERLQTEASSEPLLGSINGPSDRAFLEYADSTWRARSTLSTASLAEAGGLLPSPAARFDLMRAEDRTASGDYLVLEGKCIVLVRDFGELAHATRVVYRKAKANKVRAATLVERLVAIAGILDETTQRMVSQTPAASTREIEQLRDTLELLRTSAERGSGLVDSWGDFGTQMARGLLGRVLESLDGLTFAAEFRLVSVELASHLRELQSIPLFRENMPTMPPTLVTAAWEARDNADLVQDKEALPKELGKIVSTARDLQDALIFHGTTMVEFRQALKRHGIDTRELEAAASMMVKRERQARAHTIEFADIEIDSVIAEGSFGTVYKAKLGSDDVAVKCFRCATLGDRDLRNFEEEVAIATDIRHPNVVTTYGACFPPDPPCIIMAYAPCSLYDAIAAGLKWPDRIKVIDGLASALAFLHSRPSPLVHRDIKSHNVLLSAEGEPMLCDFGLAKHKQMLFSSGSTLPQTAHPAQNGTRPWQAPELWSLPQIFSPKSDIYALGMVMYEVASSRIPFEDITHPELLREAICSGGRPAVPDDQWGAPPAFIALMQRCWAPGAEERPDAEEVGAVCREMLADGGVARGHVAVVEWGERAPGDETPVDEGQL